MYQFEGKEYKDLGQIKSEIESRKAITMQNQNMKWKNLIVQKDQAYREYERLKNDQEQYKKSIDAEWEEIKQKLLSTVVTPEYNFISTGFYIPGELTNLSDDTLSITTSINALFRYSYVRNNDAFFIKVLPIAKSTGYGTTAEYYPIAVANYSWRSHVIAFCKGSNGPVCFRAPNYSSDWKQIRISEKEKKDYLAKATIPLDEDKTYLTKWSMKINQ